MWRCVRLEELTLQFVSAAFSHTGIHCLKCTSTSWGLSRLRFCVWQQNRVREVPSQHLSFSCVRFWGINHLFNFSFNMKLYLTGPGFQLSTAQPNQSECLHRCQCQENRRVPGIPPRHQMGCCHRGNPQQRISWCQQTPPLCPVCSCREFPGSEAGWRPPTPWRPSWWPRRSHTHPPLGCSSVY